MRECEVSYKSKRGLHAVKQIPLFLGDLPEFNRQHAEHTVESSFFCDNAWVGICLVGTRWGHFLGSQLRKVYPGLLFVSGRDPQRTQRVAQSLDAEPLTGWESAIRHPGISSLIVAMPARMHRDVGLSALRAGKHVLVEKPLATTLKDCDDLIESAQSAGVVFAVGENIPFRPDVRQAKHLMPMIGEPRLFYGLALHSANSTNDQSLGILMDFSVHYVRAVRELYGEPNRVFASCATGRTAAGAARDNVTVLLSSKDGWQATLVFSWQASPGRCPEFIATGSRGALKIWPDTPAVDFYGLEPRLWTRIISCFRPYWLRQWFESPESQRRRFRLPPGDRMGYQAELRQFLDAVTLGRPDTSSAESARRDIRIVMAAQSSLSAGRPIDCCLETSLQVA